MQQIFYFVSVVIVSGLAGVHSLQCYSCYNCTNPTDADLVTCGEPVTSPPTSAPSAATTASPGGTTASSGATSDSSVATAESSGGTTDSSGATTDSPDTGITPPWSESTLSSDFEDPSPEGARSKRSIINLNSNGCNCRNEKNCECADLFSYRNSQYADEVPYVCYKVIEQDGVIYRGCGPATWTDGTALCASEIAVNLTSCSTCDTDKCNSSFTVQSSVLLLAVAVSILLFK